MLDVNSFPVTDLQLTAAEIARLGLEREAYELDTFGLTLVRADRTGAAATCERAFNCVCDLMETRGGVRPDIERGATHEDVFTPTLYHVLHEDAVFRELLLHPMALALATLLVGRRCVCVGTEVFMKGPATGRSGSRLRLGARGDGLQLGLHSDNVTIPEPFPTTALLCNVTWLLSDYTKEGGALAFVPGSHRMCRQPFAGEAVEAAVAVEAPRGSLVIWHGNTWHGSYPRSLPGLRTGIAYAVAREFLRPYEPVRQDVSDAVVEQHPPRFAALAGRDIIDWGTEGPDYDKLVRRPFRYTAYS
jgi:ectoine hydroxylase-related dioxygenase (phytanoyl-CoA dioxygenase family)